MFLLSACASQQNGDNAQPPLSKNSSRHAEKHSDNNFPQSLVFIPHSATATPKPKQQQTPAPVGPLQMGTARGAAPYGPPLLMTDLESQLTQKLFALINSDRATKSLYAYTWNSTLAGGARLHSWNMYHCGFSHTCPDGLPPCTRVMNYGFPNQPVCGENIGYAGPYPTAWDGTRAIQESMSNEQPTQIHYQQLFSTKFHMVGVGVYVDPSGYIWFTEDIL